VPGLKKLILSGDTKWKKYVKSMKINLNCWKDKRVTSDLMYRVQVRLFRNFRMKTPNLDNKYNANVKSGSQS